MGKKPPISKWLAVGIILLFVGTCVFPATAQSTKKPLPTSRGWLHVGGSGPGNYTKIQDAINDSHDGDTVFVYDDSSPYYESLIINTSITLIGENKNTTIIDGTLATSRKIIEVTAISITLSGFCIQNCRYNHTSYTLFIDNSFGDGHHITQNIFRNNSNTALSLCAVHSEVSNNTFFNNSLALYLDEGGHHTIRDNVFINNTNSIQVFVCNWNTIHGNLIEHSDLPLFLLMSHYTVYSENIIRDNPFGGVYWFASCKNTFSHNEIANNHCGISLESSYANTITENNFINNTKYQASVSVYSPFSFLFISLFYKVLVDRNATVLSLLGRNQWDANYWSDWESSSPRPIDRVFILLSLRLLSRITGKSYPIYLSQYDWYPAQKPYDI
jgi:parallel beta-helix repeat protein